MGHIHHNPPKEKPQPVKKETVLDSLKAKIKPKEKSK